MRHTNSRKAWALGLWALLALPGCKQAEHLEQRREAAERQLAHLEHVLATRDAQMRELKQLQIADARLSQQLIPPTEEALVAAFAPLPGLRLVAEADGSTVVTGRAPLEAFAQRLQALGEAQPGVVLTVLRVDGDAVEARLQGAERPEEAPPAPAPLAHRPGAALEPGAAGAPAGGGGPHRGGA